jgi:hypothetical protein
VRSALGGRGRRIGSQPALLGAVPTDEFHGLCGHGSRVLSIHLGLPQDGGNFLDAGVGSPVAERSELGRVDEGLDEGGGIVGFIRFCVPNGGDCFLKPGRVACSPPGGGGEPLATTGRSQLWRSRQRASSRRGRCIGSGWMVGTVPRQINHGPRGEQSSDSDALVGDMGHSDRKTIQTPARLEG